MRSARTGKHTHFGLLKLFTWEQKPNIDEPIVKHEHHATKQLIKVQRNVGLNLFLRHNYFNRELILQ